VTRPLPKPLDGSVRMRGRNPELPPDDFRRLLEWGALGTNKAEVARTLGIGAASVSRYLRREHKNYRHL
jgi:DNA invertase Pin-like site-specific DNA recombinase